MINKTVGGNINYCVLIPTYNNEKTLGNVIQAALEYTSNIIVVNDGSTDSTAAILTTLADRIQVVSYSMNRGKGWAIRAGLRKAAELSFEFVITLDSDGQHDPAEIPKFLAKVHPGQPVLIIGNREMTGENIPKRSLFGRKFSNFWVRLETGLALQDTQSGFRLYTVAPMNRIHFMTVKYDFEIESLVRWAWHDYPIDTVSIRVYYPPAGERVSHFKGFKDNVRISLLNIGLVFITFFIMVPIRFIKMIFRGVSKLTRTLTGKK